MKTSDTERLVFCGNDYLGLARHPRLVEALCKAARDDGISATSGRYFAGWTDTHRRLESDLASFFGTEDACVISSAYLGGLIYFSVMAKLGRQTVFCDAQSHSNLFQGMQAAGMDIRRYRHLDADDLASQLARWSGPPPVIATDGVFGISGEMAPVKRLAELAADADAELLVDDAHGVFVLGKRQRGLCDGLDESACCRLTVMGSMSKGLGVSGGFFAGRRDVTEKLQRASTGSTPLSVPLAAACIEGLRVVREEPVLRDRMRSVAARMRTIFERHAIAPLCDGTPIIALVLQTSEGADKLAADLAERGILIRYAKYPSEPRENLLRSAARACHGEADLQRLDDALSACGGSK